jgi:hypothetical protein
MPRPYDTYDSVDVIRHEHELVHCNISEIVRNRLPTLLHSAATAIIKVKVPVTLFRSC